MAQQTINVGAAPNDGTGTPLRTAFQYTNSNFTELYTALGGGAGLPGATTQVIFNDGGTNLAGDAGLTYNKTTDTLSMGAATITGDLTVRTNKLAVTSSGVGFGTASPSAPIQVGDTTGSPEIRMSGASTAAAGPYLTFYKGGTRKTLIGNEAVLIGSGTSDALMFYTEGGNGIKWNIGSSTPSMTLDSSGNLGLGVTPSAWATTFNVKAFQTAGGSLFNFSNTGIFLTQNSFYNTSGGYSYANNGFASEYYQMDGKHIWRTAASGTAGNAVTFTQAMTLDASGNLLVGPTSANASGGVLQLSSGITFPATQVASSDANTLDDYEEGVWSPAVSGEVNLTSTTLVSARYTKIGRLVTVSGSVTTFIITSNTLAYFALQNLPFAAAAIGTAGSLWNDTRNTSGSTSVNGSVFYGFLPAASGTTSGSMMTLNFSISYTV